MNSRLSNTDKRSLAAVSLFAAFITICFINKAYTIDEPWFLALARQILRDPLHPEAFNFNWFGKTMLWSDMSNYPSYLGYPLAASLWLTGGREWLMRVTFLPFDLAAGAFLYLIAKRHLKRPLLPTLIVMASPAYFIDMPLLMSEKLIAALGFASIYGLLRGVDDDHPQWFWTSAVLAALANMVKFSSVFLIILAAVYCLIKKKPLIKIACYLLIAIFPTALYFLWGALSRHGRISSLGHWLDYALHFPWQGWIHRLRSVLAFTGGCGIVTVVWPWLQTKDRRKDYMIGLVCLATATILYIPIFDWEPATWLDRLIGIIFSAGALLSFIKTASDKKNKSSGWSLWAPWALIVAVLQFTLYWMVVARYILFLLPPLIFSMASWFEERWNPKSLRFWYVGSLAATLLPSLLLGSVDYSYAEGQREIASYMQGHYGGKKIWFTGHWGLQYYMEGIGAQGLDGNLGGWDAVQKSDVVLMPKVNTNILKPNHKIFSNVSRITIETPVPLRLIHNGARQAGFYASVGGFLPYTLSRDPLEEYTIIEAL